MKQKILISGLGGSLFPYLHEQLKNKYNLFYVDSNACLAYVYPEYNFFIVPNVTADNYFSCIKNIIEENKIDYYLPLIDEEIIGAIALEGFQGVKVIAADKDFCELSMNKFRLMCALDKKNISTILSYTGDKFTYDTSKVYFVKPITGRGSRGIKKIESEQQLQAYYQLENYAPEEILIQEYISGTEYTVGVTVNKLNQILLISTRRIISKRGITQNAQTERNEMIYAMSKQLVEKLQPKGSINIQLFQTTDGELKIFEINPRFSTTTIMNYAAGIDELSLLIEYLKKEYRGEVLEPKEKVVLYRRWENVFYEE